MARAGARATATLSQLHASSGALGIWGQILAGGPQTGGRTQGQVVAPVGPQGRHTGSGEMTVPSSPRTRVPSPTDGEHPHQVCSDPSQLPSVLGHLPK